MNKAKSRDETDDLKKYFIPIVIVVAIVTFAALNFGMAVHEQVNQKQPPVVNGSDGQRKDIVIGDNTVIIFGEVRYSSGGVIQNSGYGDIYAVAGQLQATPDVLYGNVHWTLVREEAGWLVYITEGDD